MSRGAYYKTVRGWWEANPGKSPPPRLMETPSSRVGDANSPGTGAGRGEGDGSTTKKVEDDNSIFVLLGYPDAASYVEAKGEVRCPFIKIGEKGTKKIPRYPCKEIIEHVSSILNSNGIVPSGKAIDPGSLKGYQYFGATLIDKSDSQ
ncbi:hypothetical protein EJB05_19789, partial [Eragrostis curvula]